MDFDGFDWDVGNRDKCRQHGVPLADIESLFSGTVLVMPDPAHSVTEERFRAIGKTLVGRWVFLIWSWRERGDRRLIRPISARYMHAKEVRHYETMAEPDQ